MAIAFTSTPNVAPAGAMPTAPTRVRKVRMTFVAGDTYTTSGWDIAAAFAAAFPGEQIVSGHAHLSLSGATVRIFEIIPGTTPRVFAVEENGGTMRQVPNLTDLSGHSPLDLTVVTQ